MQLLFAKIVEDKVLYAKVLIALEIFRQCSSECQHHGLEMIVTTMDEFVVRAVVPLVRHSCLIGEWVALFLIVAMKRSNRTRTW